MKSTTKFNERYDTSHEQSALQTRGAFIGAFPLRSLRDIKLEQYVVGHGKPTFCNLVESGTKAWANIQGATSSKFGIYFGRTKSDPTRKYRFIKKFGKSKNRAFAAIKIALLNLVALGSAEHPDFASIDENPLSQLFKAKILSLYFPDRFLAVCSSEHLEILGEMLNFPADLPSSEYQNLLIKAKRRNSVTRKWTGPKFMAFLYNAYVRPNQPIESPIIKPRPKNYRRVDFDELQKQNAEIGRLAEKFALRWEKERLDGAGLKHLIKKIEDRRERPGFGHDYLSYSADNEQRYIEVKSVAKRSDGHRFFLSETERRTSISADHIRGYYFYLVYFGAERKPVELDAIPAPWLYPNAELSPSSYEVRFDRRDLRRSDK